MEKEIKVFISTTTFGQYDNAPLKTLAMKGLTAVTNPYARKMTGAECIEAFKDIAGLIAGTEPLTEDVLESAKSLKAISRCGTGLDNVDLDAAKRLGITVFNTPDAPTAAVAELTVGLMVSLLRKVGLMDGEMRRGLWQKKMGNLLGGKRVGIVGFGRIGRRVAELLLPFGCEVAYTDPLVDRGESFRRMSLEELLGWADIVSLHLSARTRIIGEAELRAMKKGAWLINLSRGAVVDEAALEGCLRDGRLSGAALDVFEKEPYQGGLSGLENVILTPHIGSYAMETRIAMEKQAVENLLRGLKEAGVI